LKAPVSSQQAANIGAPNSNRRKLSIDADLDRHRTATTDTADFLAYQAVAALHEPTGRHNATAAPHPLIHRTPAPARAPVLYTYSCSHGSTRNISHTSISYLNKSNGRQDTATTENTMNDFYQSLDSANSLRHPRKRE
jgi:hypothetical protein